MKKTKSLNLADLYKKKKPQEGKNMKRDIELLISKISNKLQDPSNVKKAAQILENMIKKGENSKKRKSG